MGIRKSVEALTNQRLNYMQHLNTLNTGNSVRRFFIGYGNLVTQSVQTQQSDPKCLIKKISLNTLLLTRSA